MLVKAVSKTTSEEIYGISKEKMEIVGHNTKINTEALLTRTE